MVEDRHLCVIGGTSGIGLATAQRFVDEGGTVTIVGRDSTRLKAALEQLGPNATGAAIDAADRPALDAFFAQAQNIDYLVIAASSGVATAPFREIEVETLRRGFDNKFYTHFNVAQAALPVMAERGSITFVAGATARFANPGTIGLAAVNGAVCQLVPTLARELVPSRVVRSCRNRQVAVAFRSEEARKPQRSLYPRGG